jgi:hypothetical protein
MYDYVNGFTASLLWANFERMESNVSFLLWRVGLFKGLN